MVLCGANSYEEKYYLNSEFDGLPEQIKDELRILCVLHTAEFRGILILEFDDDGNLLLKAEAAEDDYSYDEIGSELKIRKILREKEELFRSLELYYKVFIKGQGRDELLKEEKK